MKYKNAIILLLLIANRLYCQQSILNDSISLNKGFYRDFFEFKYNKPSLPFNYKIDTCIEKYGEQPPDGPHKYYKIKIDKSQAKLLRDAYGFCDGKNVYVSVDMKLIKNVMLFEKLIFRGRYCLYQNKPIENVHVPIPSSGLMPISTGVLLPAKGKLTNIIIDFNNGNQFHLTRQLIENLIKDDIFLLEKFHSNNYSELELSKIIIEYSLSHKNDLIINSTDFTTGDICKFLQKMPSDSSNDFYYNRISSTLPKMINIKNIGLWESKYGNGNYRFIGLRGYHNIHQNPEYGYKIGYWRYFYKNGDLKKEIIFDLVENKLYIKEYKKK
jgi:hypothetical protein